MPDATQHADADLLDWCPVHRDRICPEDCTAFDTPPAAAGAH